MNHLDDTVWSPLPLAAVELGESPLWHPTEQVLYWVDIPGHALHRYDPVRALHDHWGFDTDISCCAPALGGGLVVTLRSGIEHFDPATGKRRALAEPPYDAAKQRFNDGRADALGRLWVGTIDDARAPQAALFRFTKGRVEKQAEGITVSNGLAFSPDSRTMYWADTKAHVVYAFDFNLAQGTLARQRVFAQFAPRADGQPLETYGGRPDGAAVDAEGAYWVAMFEGQRLLRFAPTGEPLLEVKLPVRCATMPCFGGPDLKTLYLTTAREKRPADELARQPLAGCVLQMRVDVPGLPANFVQL